MAKLFNYSIDNDLAYRYTDDINWRLRQLAHSRHPTIVLPAIEACPSNLDLNKITNRSIYKIYEKLALLEASLGAFFTSSSVPLLLELKLWHVERKPMLINVVSNLGLQPDNLHCFLDESDPLVPYISYSELIRRFIKSVTKLKYEDEKLLDTGNFVLPEQAFIPIWKIIYGEALIQWVLDICEDLIGEPFPINPYKQLEHYMRRNWREILNNVAKFNHNLVNYFISIEITYPLYDNPKEITPLTSPEILKLITNGGYLNEQGELESLAYHHKRSTHLYQ